MEPFGADTRGLDEETLTGPERAMGIARSADSLTNWGQNFLVTEPIPVTIDGGLWWHIKVAPTDFTDVTRNVFVSAQTGHTVEMRDDSAVSAFINGTVAEDALEPTEEGNVVERIPVEPDQDTTIVGPDDERARDNATASSD